MTKDFNTCFHLIPYDTVLQSSAAAVKVMAKFIPSQSETHSESHLKKEKETYLCFHQLV